MAVCYHRKKIVFFSLVAAHLRLKFKMLMSKNSRVKFTKTAVALSGCAVLLVLLAVSCTRDAWDPECVNVGTAPFPSTYNFDCGKSPVYEDTILCAKYRGPNSDYFARPRNNRTEKGKYYAWPAGLKIDINTGAINVTRSDAGMQYIIGFVKDGTTDTCHTRIVVAGIHYKDNIYVLANNDTLAIPYFNASPIITPVCDPSGDDDYPGVGNPGGGNNRCEFDDDEDDDNANGNLDEPPAGQQANEQFVRVRTRSGIINLKKSLQDGAFGQNPQNGAMKDVMIYYRLADCSQKALRNIKVRLIYYDRKSDVPAQLASEVSQRKLRFEGYQPIRGGMAMDSPRPPLIIVTRIE